MARSQPSHFTPQCMGPVLAGRQAAGEHSCGERERREGGGRRKETETKREWSGVIVHIHKYRTLYDFMHHLGWVSQDELKNAHKYHIIKSLGSRATLAPS